MDEALGSTLARQRFYTFTSRDGSGDEQVITEEATETFWYYTHALKLFRLSLAMTPRCRPPSNTGPSSTSAKPGGGVRSSGERCIGLNHGQAVCSRLYGMFTPRLAEQPHFDGAAFGRTTAGLKQGGGFLYERRKGTEAVTPGDERRIELLQDFFHLRQEQPALPVRLCALVVGLHQLV